MTFRVFSGKLAFSWAKAGTEVGFLHFSRAMVVDLGDSLQTHLSSGVDPTAGAQAEQNPAFLATQHTK
jgi:hypothetical protein